MKQKIFALLILLTMVVSLVVVGLADVKRKKPAPKTDELVALLPESDMAMAIDGKRMFAEAIPQILSSNQPMLADINVAIDEAKSRTGIDLRQFDRIAVGVKAVEKAPKSYDFEPLVLARGPVSAESAIAVAKAVSNGKYREEKIGGRSVYVFSPAEMISKGKGKTSGTVFSGVIDVFLGGLSGEMAVTGLDSDTLAVGSLKQMSALFEAKSKISADLLETVSKKSDAVMSFGARMPKGLSQVISLDNDELGKNLDAVRSLSGSMDVVAGSASVSIAAKTADAVSAKGIKDTLDGLQAFGKAMLGSSKRADQQVYARMIEGAKISLAGNEVTLDLKIAQADLDVIIGKK